MLFRFNRSALRVPIRYFTMQAALGSTTNRPLDDLVALDHRSFEDLYARYQRAEGDRQDQTRIANELIREAAIHSAGEEMTFYATVEKHRGKEAADQMRQEHQTVKDNLYELTKMEVGTLAYDNLLSKTVEELMHHARDEEQDVLPWLRGVLGADGMLALGREFLGAKRTAPTRPHPSAPDKPWSEFMAGLFAAPMDKAADYTREFAERCVPEE